MKKLIGLLLFALASQQTFAEGTEISLFTGYRVGGEVENASSGDKVTFDEANSQGIILGFDYDPEHVVEFLYSRQSTDLRDNNNTPNPKLMGVDLEYYQLGGSRVWRSKAMDSFFGATLGAIHLSPDSGALSSQSRFAMSLGGGAIFKLTKNIGLRLEIRGYFSSLGSSSTFCDGSNQCIVVGDGFMQQYDINAGLRFRF